MRRGTEVVGEYLRAFSQVGYDVGRDLRCTAAQRLTWSLFQLLDARAEPSPPRGEGIRPLEDERSGEAEAEKVT